MKTGLAVAPWVVTREERGSVLLFGPDHVLLRVPHPLEGLEPEDEQVQWLLEQGMLAPVGARSAQPLADTAKRAGAYVVPLNGDGEGAQRLVQALRALEGEEAWAVAPSVEEVRARVQGAPRRPVLVLLQDQEPRRLVEYLEPILDFAEVLWFGECTEGTHAGPLLKDREEVARYEEATQGWVEARRVASLGFSEAWPLPLSLRIQQDPDSVARAVSAVRHGLPEICVLLKGEREVSLWTALLSRDCSQDVLRAQQRWPKGLLRGLTVSTLEESAGGYLGVCLTPAGGLDDLESNSGKGLTLEEATWRTVGEAVERFGAWRANFQRAKTLERPERRLALADFHPFGPRWEEYLRLGSPPLPEAGARELSSGEPVAVPECLVPFPYLPAEGGSRPTTSDTSGLAVFSSPSGALLRGIREILERHNLYPNFRHQRPGCLLASEEVCEDQPALLQVVRTLQRDGRLWLLVYPDALFQVPIVHAFYFHPATRRLSRGSGSGLTFSSAAQGAILEALQLYAQVVKGPPTLHAPAYTAWMHEDVIQEVTTYLERQPRGAPPPHGAPTEQAQLEQLTSRGRSSFLAVSLPCPVNGWCAVRVLAPGLTTNQYPSESAGGARLSHPVFRHLIPT